MNRKTILRLVKALPAMSGVFVCHLHGEDIPTYVGTPIEISDADFNKLIKTPEKTSNISILSVKTNEPKAPPETIKNTIEEKIKADSENAGQDPSAAIPKLDIKFSEDATLAAITLWAGRPYGARIFSVTVTSAIPATNTDTTNSSAYSNSQLGFPTNGVLNLHLNVLFHGIRGSNFAIGGMDDQVFYGDREKAYDRYYFGWHKPEVIAESGGKKTIIPKISSGRFLWYVCDGIGPQVIFRGSSAVKGTTQEAGDYGVAADAYFGFGFDGALVGRKTKRGKSQTPLTTVDKSELHSDGMYRVEFLLDGKYIDKVSMRKLYPNAIDPTPWIGNACGRFEFSITKQIAVNVQASYPIGACTKFMSRSLFGGFSFSH
jgi:hypothetical protein